MWVAGVSTVATKRHPNRCISTHHRWYTDNLQLGLTARAKASPEGKTRAGVNSPLPKKPPMQWIQLAQFLKGLFRPKSAAHYGTSMY